MRQWIVNLWAMYRKDLREIRGIGLALVAYGIIVHAVYVALHKLPRMNIMSYSPFMSRFRDLAVAMPYVFPTLLAYMLFQKRRDESRYLEQSLPVWRGMPVVTAWLALMPVVLAYAVTTQLVSAVFSAARIYAMYQSTEAAIAGPDVTVSRWALMWRLTSQSFLSSSGLIFIDNLSGIVCLASGFASPFASKHWGWYWMAFVGTIATIYGVPALMARFGVDAIPAWWIQSWLLPGLAFVLAGAWLSGRFGEV